MSTRLALSLRHAFVLRRDTLGRLVRILDSRIGPTITTAYCADHVQREFTKLSDLLNFDNTKAKQIRLLELSAHSDDWERAATLTFADGAEAISLSLRGTDSEILQLKQELLDVLDATKAWYSAISRVRLWWILVAALMFLFGVARLAVPDSPQPATGMSLGKAVLLSSATLLGVGLFLAACWAVDRVQQRRFPMAFFALGQGRARYDFDDRVRWTVIIGLVVSAFASLVVAFATGALGR
jgi:hypothetical protein